MAWRVDTNSRADKRAVQRVRGPAFGIDDHEDAEDQAARGFVVVAVPAVVG
jgi:hypothetical protein